MPPQSPTLPDATHALQQVISNACSRSNNDNSSKKDVTGSHSVPASTSPSASAPVTSIQLEKGDYAVQMLQIPQNSKVLLFSRDRVRLLYIGKRNRPMFVLQDNSVLILREKLEIYYNTNNIQEVMRLMIRSPQTSMVDVSKEVKISLFSMKQG